MSAQLQAGPALSVLPSQAGWEGLVAPLARAAVLCLDDELLAVASLAQRCASVCVLARDDASAEALRARHAASGWDHVSVVSLGSDADLARLARSRFDGAVFCDLAGTAQAKFPGGLRALAALAGPLLCEGAFVMFGAPNRWGLSRDRTLGRLRYAWSWRALRALLHRAGAWGVVVHPVLLNEYKLLAESITPTGYRATKNHGLRRERLKEWLWGARTARWFAPALIAVGWVGATRGSMMDVIGESLGTVDGSTSLVQYLALLSGKVIATYVAASRPEPARVVVVTRDPLTVERRTREAATLCRLAASLPAPLAALLPRVLGRFEVDGSVCFVLRHVPGVTADAVVPGLAQITRQAHRFLLDLHRATVTTGTMDEATWQGGVGAVFAAAVARHPVVGAELGRLEEAVAAATRGRAWVSVCTHGDFKIENVMYDPASRAITGVIDWEHALLPGWPYLDTGYLLAYNRTLRGATWVAAARELLEERFDAAERSVDADYWSATGVPGHLVPVCRALCVVHHLGCRWHGVWSPELLDELRALLGAATTRVADGARTV